MLAVYLSGVVLLFLLYYTTLNIVNRQSINSNTLVDEQNIDISTLARIFTFFEQNYKRFENEEDLQYALAINVPKEQCQAGFVPSKDNFLTKENPDEVKHAISKNDYPVYHGKELIGAGVQFMKDGTKHSESLLLNLEGRLTTPMQDLLDTRKDDSCTVFYTLNSPCADTCLNEDCPYNILQGLNTWGAHPSIKALVFKKIWIFDEPRRVVFEAALRKIVNRNVPVYRCINENVCYACGGKDGPFNDHCLSDQHLCTV